MRQIELSSAIDERGTQEQSLQQTPVRRLHPQLALWLVRGFLGTTIASIAVALLPGKNVPPPLTPASTLVRPAQSEMTAMLAFVTISPPLEAQATAVVTPAAHDVQPHTATPSATPVPSDASRAKRPVARERAVKPSRLQNRHRAYRSSPRPLSALARGARRTIRTVGGKFARLL